MNPITTPLPTRSLVTLVVVAVLAALIVSAVLLLVWSRLPRASVALLIGAIVALTVSALWLLFIAPAYWD